MENKEPVRQRTTAMRKLPGAPAPSEGAPARPAPLRPGPGMPPRKPLGARPAPVAPAGGGSGLKKFLMLFIVLGLVGGVAYGFIRKDASGVSLWGKVLHKFGIMKADSSAEAKAKEAKPIAKGKKRLDLGYEAAVASKIRAEAYLKTELAKYDADPGRITQEIAKEVSKDLQRHGLAMQKSVGDLTTVCKNIAGGEPADVDGKKANEELEAGKKLLKELGELAKKWKEIGATAPAEPTAVAKPDPEPPKDPKPELKPELKPVDPKSEPERPPVASGRPTEKPKEEPKKPEPEKPKEEPKAEPEKPKPEPEKPKAESPSAKPTEDKPEKPKAEPEKSKPEPEKPKEEPKPEPKPEPAKPKVEVILADAEKLLIDGSQFYKELVEAMKNLPDDADRLKALLSKKDTARAFFTKARDAYLSVKENAPDPAKLEKQLGKIELLMSRLQKYEEEIKSKLK